MTSRRTLFITVLALVAAPVLAGCADNAGDDNGGTNNDTNNPTSGTSTPPGGNTPSLTLKLGGMFPLSGPLANLGPDMRAGAELAIEEINAANVGITITMDVEDDRTVDSAAAPNTFQRLVSNGATAVIGPCCSGVTLAALEKAVENEVVLASPSATGPGLTARENDGFFWRLAPSDALQGRVLAKVIQDDGVSRVAVVAINNAYGNGLANVFEDVYTAGGNTITTTQSFNENAEEFSSVVTQACANNPEAIVIFGYIAQGGNILKEMNRQGCLSNVAVYGSEGLYDGEGTKGIAEAAGTDTSGKALAAGVKGTRPDSGDLTSWNEKFRAKHGRDPNQYSAESYDAVMYVALAALAANSVEGRDIADNLLDVATGGTKVSDFRVAAQALLNGDDIDWKGQAHDFDYTDDHEPDKGVYAVWEVDQTGNVATISTGHIAGDE